LRRRSVRNDCESPPRLHHQGGVVEQGVDVEERCADAEVPKLWLNPHLARLHTES
jgi:hypothetical protein